MKIDVGIVSNCSETVYRLNSDDFSEHAEELLEAMISSMLGSFESFGYSDMVPDAGEICVYFGQSFGGRFLEALEKNKIPYTTDQWMTSFSGFEGDPAEDYYDKVPDGLGEYYYRRKSYVNYPPLVSSQDEGN